MITKKQALEVAKTVHGWMRREEMSWLYDVAQRLPAGAAWVEIGSWKGRSLIPTGLALADDTYLTSVESFTGSFDSPGTHLETKLPHDWLRGHLDLAIDLIAALRPNVHVTLIESKSQKVAGMFKNKSIDVIFIDGEHNAKGVARDINLWRPKLKAGGILCGHDRGHPGVRKALAETVGSICKAPGSIWFQKQGG